MIKEWIIRLLGGVTKEDYDYIKDTLIQVQTDREFTIRSLQQKLDEAEQSIVYYKQESSSYFSQLKEKDKQIQDLQSKLDVLSGTKEEYILEDGSKLYLDSKKKFVIVLSSGEKIYVSLDKK